MITTLLFISMLAWDGSWASFSDWFSKEGTPGPPVEVLKAYKAQLSRQGLSETDSQAKIEEVQAYIASHPQDALVLHFNRIFTWTAAPFSREPSEFVKKIASKRKPGRALDIAMGQGRNAIWLAKAGWTVSGYDISDEALRQANALASKAGVALDTKLASHDEYDLGQSKWDLIVMSYAFTNLHDGAYMKRVRESLTPGGALVVEGFGSPRGESNAMLKTLLDYRVIVFEDLPDVADWGKMTAPLTRMALERP